MRTAIGLVACLSLAAFVQALSPLAGVGPEAGMAREAKAFLASLPDEARARALIPFDDPERADWHYVPRERRGVRIGDLAGEPRERLDALLRSALSRSGQEKVEGILGLERVLFELESRPDAPATWRDPGNYFVAVFGDPERDGPWGWCIEGHHLSLHFTCVGERTLSVTPHFLGAAPLSVPDWRGSGEAFLVLGSEETRAREFLAALAPELRALAVRDGRPPEEILLVPETRADSLAREGLTLESLGADGRQRFFDALAEFAYHLRPELADPELERARSTDAAELSFLWIGSTKPGDPFYFRLQGPSFVVEYENGRPGADHVHSVWRDPRNDFGEDTLRAHLARDHAGARER